MEHFTNVELSTLKKSNLISSYSKLYDYLAHWRCAIFYFQQQFHDLTILLLFRRQCILVNVNEQFIEVLHVVRFHHRQVALRLEINNLCLTVGRLHPETHWRTGHWRRCCCQLASRCSDWYIAGWWLKNLHENQNQRNLSASEFCPARNSSYSQALIVHRKQDEPKILLKLFEKADLSNSYI